MQKKEFEDYKYEEEHFKLFFKFDRRGDKINNIKNISIGLFVFLLLISQLYIEYDLGYFTSTIEKIPFIHKEIKILSWFGIEILGIFIFVIVLIVYPLIVKLSKYFLYCTMVNKNDRKKQLAKSNFLKLILSPDAYYSEYYKEKLKNRFYNNKIYLENNGIFYTDESRENGIELSDWNQIRIERKFFIEWSNWINCVITVITCLLSFILIYFFNNIYIVEIFLILMIYRCYSRSIEIGLSFYKDVVNRKAKIIYWKSVAIDYELGFKSSIIRSNGRLSLAVHSLIELVFLYGNIYFINSLVSNVFDTIFTPFNSLMFSASLGVFNISFDYESSKGVFLQSLLHVSQVIISVILILLSIAQYLGDNNKLSDKDKELYLEVEKLKK